MRGGAGKCCAISFDEAAQAGSPQRGAVDRLERSSDQLSKRTFVAGFGVTLDEFGIGRHGLSLERPLDAKTAQKGDERKRVRGPRLGEKSG